MKNDAMIVLKVIAAVTNVMVGQGIFLPCPMAVNVCGHIKQFIKLVNNDSCRVFTADDKSESILEELVRRSIDPVLFYFDGSYRAETRLAKIINVVKAGEYLGKSIIRLPIVLLDKSVPDSVLEETFFIDIAENNIAELFIWDVLPDPEKLPLVFDKISDLSSGLTEEGKFLKSGICFTYPYFRSIQNLADYESLQQLGDSMIELDEQSKDGYGLSAQFVKAMYDYRDDDGKKLRLLDLPNVHTEVSDKTDRFMFHDFKYVYMSNKLFGKIAADLKKMVGLNRLKEILAEDGVLLKGNGKTYTSKMPYYNQYGELQRADFLRFNIEELQRPGKLEFIKYFGGGRDEN